MFIIVVVISWITLQLILLVFAFLMVFAMSVLVMLLGCDL